MVKLLVKLALAAFIANATWRVGSEYLNHYRFRDSVREAATWRNRSEAEFRTAIFEEANQYDIPLTPEDVLIDRDPRHTLVEGHYVKAILLLPGRTFDWPFSWTVEVYTTPGIGDPARP
jgi:hypothetical protein